MKKIIFILVLLSLLFDFSPTVFAQGTILPGTTMKVEVKKEDEGCKKLLQRVERGDTAFGSDNANDILGCAIKTGNIELWMIPHFVIYAVETLLGVAGLISVLFIVVGGYQYAIGGLTEERDKAKKTIMYAIAGLVVALLAWAIVNLVQLALTI